MAKYTILDQSPGLTRILVEFEGQAFEQQVLLDKPEDLQAYADEYEAAWKELPSE